MCVDEEIVRAVARRRPDMVRNGMWPDILLLGRLAAAVADCPERAAIIGRNSEADQAAVLTFSELDDRARRIASGLKRSGIRPGDVVSFQLPNWWQFAAIHLACLYIGAVSNPLMPIFRERELGFMLDLVRSKLIIVPERFRKFDYPAMVHGLRTGSGAPLQVFVVGTTGPNSFETELLSAPSVVEPSPLRPDDVVQILFTSGTTGEPKGVVHSSNTLFSNLVPYARRMGLGPDSVILMASPLAHQTGFMYGMMLPIYLHCPVVLQDIWNAAEAAENIKLHGVTYTMASTPFLTDLAEQAKVKADALRSLRLFHSAGAPIPRSLVRAAHESMGARIVSGWGMTENGAAACARPEDPDEKIFGTDGYPMPGVELRVLGLDNQALQAGEEGRLQIRACSNFLGYFRRPHLNQIDCDGWFETGDFARLDADGYLRITGRIKDIIIRGGENIPSVEVEGVIYRMPLIREVAIVGVPDDRLGERACACVSTRDNVPLSLEEILTHLDEAKVAKQYWPESLLLLSDLPKTPSGKIQKFKLRQEARELIGKR